MEVYFFGCETGSRGHYIYQHPGRWAAPGLYEEIKQALGGVGLDTHLLKEAKISDSQGLAVFVQRGGYSIVSFWDNGGDGRPGSNSAFIVKGIVSAAEVIRLGIEKFPSMAERAATIKFAQTTS